MSAAAVREVPTPAALQHLMGARYPVSDQQWAAVTAPLEPGVVVAGAGSGKTTLMAARVVYLVATGQVAPHEVLGLTFTTKAASELRQRITAALATARAVMKSDAPPSVERSTEEGDEPLEPTILTYNAYAARLLTEHGLRIGHEPDTRVVTDAARYQLGARVVDRFTGDVHHLTDHPPTAIQNLLALDSAMSEHLVAPDDVAAFDAEQRRGFERAVADEVAGKDRKTYREAPEKAISAIDRRAELLALVADYRRLKADLGLMDFSDQIELGARLARTVPEVGAVEREAFRVVLLDEYQDTSVAQATMLARLFSGPDDRSGRGHPVTAVGDPNQAIYGWRGAAASNIVAFDTTFPPATGSPSLFHLTVSRRSGRAILDVANRLAGPLHAKYDQVEPLVPDPANGVGEVEVAVHETRDDELVALAATVRSRHTGADGGRWRDVGVLTRDNAHAAEVYDALSAADIPVEIVGLSGLLRLPEVADVVATLHLLHDVTHNPSLLLLLTGPRWAIGSRDLALLSRRARQLSGRPSVARDGPPGAADEVLGAQLAEIADGVDPAELPALDDALADPGVELAFSEAARDRFAALAAELRYLRGHVGEPLLDLVRRVIEASGTDVELASATGDAASARRENLDLFLKAVADFESVDGDVTLPALLAYLTAEDDQGNGLDLATPSEADSVKLLTVHRAKGLEWPEVHLVGVCERRFPSNRSRTLWISSPAVLPAPLRGDADDLPQLTGHDKAALDAYRAATRTHDAEEELRLGYVAVTRPAQRLSVTSYCWGPQKTPYGPSQYQRTIAELLGEWGRFPEHWRDKPEKDEPNPYAAVDSSRPWPPTRSSPEMDRRRAAASVVRSLSADAGRAEGSVDDDLDLVAAAQVAEWDDAIERLLAEARRDRSTVVDVAVPTSLSATTVSRLRDDPEAVARELARPMPRPPSPEARFGTRFHAWVEERFGQLMLIDLDELTGRADEDLVDDDELAGLMERFDAGPFGTRVPAAVEPSFAVVLGGQVVRGRIDAVYDEPAADGSPGYLVVDWKTNRRQDADPLQLAIYRQAWAELAGVPVENVRAGFYYVRTGDLVEPPELPDRAQLERLVAGGTDVADEG